MIFNSLEFAIFLPIVFVVYWFVLNKNLTLQNLFVLASSYLFYGWWDYRFLSLIVISTVVDYFVGIYLHKFKKPKIRTLLILASLVINIGFLLYFKYFNFFIDSLTSALEGLGVTINTRTLNIVLPVGISFYTFQTLSYSIDIYRKKLEPTKDFVAFATFVSFFPQLVAGPIERASNLLPQFNKTRTFDFKKSRDGMRQILWGLFKKVVIADNIAQYVNDIFGSSDHLYGSTLIIGVIYFAFQIYCDFSGYSDIAIGTARLFGFSLMQNFAFPYFSRDISEFWRRWHISLSTWFRDYVYIPLGGSRVSNILKLRNTMAIFVVSGLWHGANWTFVIWGFLNALYYLPLMYLKKNRVNTDTVAEGHLLPGFRDIVNMFLTFSLTLIAWIFFRAENLEHAFSYIGHMFSRDVFTLPSGYMTYLPYIGVLLIVEWIQRTKKHALEIDSVPRIIRWLVYYILIYFILNKGGSQETFIYFQF